ncbi:hypothetical protein PR202_gb06407 [Eleusine coracana subsp. coracana]|uniref:Ubiquitin receptor RAD23 n=1 Tax=Eleusine coracana subsp. coracana TaxID=191504 RepID=A0AAV5EA81_ELECO|nr:hypothetical protein PR202_gb06407 [Eleusine coracana subsp. coracana]
MRITVKTLKGTHFEIRVQPNDTAIAYNRQVPGHHTSVVLLVLGPSLIMHVKKNIEEMQGKDNYPWGQQLLIFNGKVLKDESTLEENKVKEDGFLVVMLSKSKTSGSTGASSGQPSSTPSTRQTPPLDPPQQAIQTPAAPPTTSQPEGPPAQAPSNVHDNAASNLLSGGNLDSMINQITEMGGGSWDRDEVQRAFRAAYNNPERAVEYLYSGIPVTAEVGVPIGGQGVNMNDPAPTGEAALSGIPNTAPLDLFPQELSKHNPQILRLIQENHDEFLQLLNEPFEGGAGDFLEQAEQDEMPHAINVTAEEQEAIGRLEAMGFDRARVIEAFFACDRNEQLAANYLLEHAADED